MSHIKEDTPGCHQRARGLSTPLATLVNTYLVGQFGQAVSGVVRRWVETSGWEGLSSGPPSATESRHWSGCRVASRPSSPIRPRV